MYENEDSCEMHEEHGFEIQIPRRRSQYENGNIILYSLNDSFVEGYMWRIVIGPAEENLLKGYLSKVPIASDSQSHSSIRSGVETTWAEAERALRSTFTHNNNDMRDELELKVNKLEIIPQCDIKWTEDMHTNVAFTVRGKGFEKAAKNEEGIKINGKVGSLLTSDIKEGVSYKSVYGLLWSINDINLKEAAVFLGEKYGKAAIRYLIHCTNPDKYQEYWELGV